MAEVITELVKKQLERVTPRLFCTMYLYTHPEIIQQDLATVFSMKPQAFSKLLSRPTGTFNDAQRKLAADMICENDFSALREEINDFFRAVDRIKFGNCAEKVFPLLLQLHQAQYPGVSFQQELKGDCLVFWDDKRMSRILYFIDYDGKYTAPSYLSTQRKNDSLLRGSPWSIEKVLCTDSEKVAYQLDGMNLWPNVFHRAILFTKGFQKVIDIVG